MIFQKVTILQPETGLQKQTIWNANYPKVIEEKTLGDFYENLRVRIHKYIVFEIGTMKTLKIEWQK